MRDLAVDLADTLRAANGTGLSAPQVGVPLAMIAVSLGRGFGDGRQVLILLNPVILEWSSAKEVAHEGCLSFPGSAVEVERSAIVKVLVGDLQRNIEVISARGPTGRAIQHEVEHLHGGLIVDNASPLSRQLIEMQSKRWAQQSAIDYDRPRN